MNGKDIFKAFDAVDEGLIEQAIPREGKKVRARFLPAAAAACLILGVGAAMAVAWSNTVSIPNKKQQADLSVNTITPRSELPTEKPTPDATENSALTSEPVSTETLRIIWGKDEILDSHVPQRGEILMPGSLEEAINDEKNSDCLFAVCITPYRGKEATKIVNESWYNEWLKLFENPIIKRFLADYENYITPEWPSFTPEELQEMYQGEGPMDVVPKRKFMLEWKKELTEEEWESFTAAKEEIDEIWMNNPKYEDVADQLMREEILRLIALGYDLDENGMGFLTAEQIKTFAKKNPDIGYIIQWQDRDDPMDA